MRNYCQVWRATMWHIVLLMRNLVWVRSATFRIAWFRSAHFNSDARKVVTQRGSDKHLWLCQMCTVLTRHSSDHQPRLRKVCKLVTRRSANTPLPLRCTKLWLDMVPTSNCVWLLCATFWLGIVLITKTLLGKVSSSLIQRFSDKQSFWLRGASFWLGPVELLTSNWSRVSCAKLWLIVALPSNVVWFRCEQCWPW